MDILAMIHECEEHLADAVNRGDLDAIVDSHTEDCWVLAPGQPLKRGTEAVPGLPHRRAPAADTPTAWRFGVQGEPRSPAGWRDDPQRRRALAAARPWRWRLQARARGQSALRAGGHPPLCRERGRGGAQRRHGGQARARQGPHHTEGGLS